MSELTRRVKQKYPQYQNIPNEQLEQMVLNKYPEYGNMTGIKGWLTEGQKGGWGALRAAGNVLNLPSYAIGGMLDAYNENGFSGLNPLKNPFGIPTAVSGVQNKKTVMEEWPQFLGMNPNSPIGLATGFIGELGTPDPIGGLSDAYKAVKGLENSRDVGLAAKGVQKLGKNISDYADQLPLRGLGRNKKTQKLISQLDRLGISTQEFMDEFNLWGRSVDDANEVLSSIDDAYKAAAFGSGKSVDTSNVVRQLDKKINDLLPAAEQSDSVMAQVERLKRAKEGFLKSIQSNGSTPLKTPVSKVAEAKSFVSQDIPQSYFNAGASQKGKGKGAEVARQTYKNIVDKATGGETARLGGRESALITYRDLLKSKEVADKGNKNFSFTKALTPGLGGIFAGIPGLIAGFGIDTIANSAPGISTQTKALSRVGKALQDSRAGKLADKGLSAIKNLTTTGFRVSQQPSRGISGNQSNQLQPRQVNRAKDPLPREKSFPTPSVNPLFIQPEYSKKRLFR